MPESLPWNTPIEDELESIPPENRHYGKSIVARVLESPALRYYRSTPRGLGSGSFLDAYQDAIATQYEAMGVPTIILQPPKESMPILDLVTLDELKTGQWYQRHVPEGSPYKPIRILCVGTTDDGPVWVHLDKKTGHLSSAEWLRGADPKFIHLKGCDDWDWKTAEQQAGQVGPNYRLIDKYSEKPQEGDEYWSACHGEWRRRDSDVLGFMPHTAYRRLKEIDPGEGYRLIDKAKDKPQEEDEYFDHSDQEWRRRAAWHGNFTQNDVYRRKVAVAAKFKSGDLVWVEPAIGRAFAAKVIEQAEPADGTPRYRCRSLGYHENPMTVLVLPENSLYAAEVVPFDRVTIQPYKDLWVEFNLGEGSDDNGGSYRINAMGDTCCVGTVWVTYPTLANEYKFEGTEHPCGRIRPVRS